MGVSILFNNKWKLQDTSISVPALEEKKRYVWVCVYLQASQHLIHSPSTWALWNEQSRTAFLAWSLTKPVNSTEGCAELYSQETEADWQKPKDFHILCYPACHSAIYMAWDCLVHRQGIKTLPV